MKKRFLVAIAFVVGLNLTIYADYDTLIKDRTPFGKTIRTRMPPQIFINTIQDDLHAHSPGWKTFFQNFVVEDDEDKDEYVIVARTVEKPWAFGLTKQDCPKPVNFNALQSQIAQGGTPVRMDVLIGVKRKRSFFRYVITVYEPKFDFQKNPCYEWNLPPGMAQDEFYQMNYTMRVYADNLQKEIHEMVSQYSSWRPPKNPKKIPAIRGSGQEIIGGESESLTDEEKKLPVGEQEKLLEEKRKKKRGWFR